MEITLRQNPARCSLFPGRHNSEKRSGPHPCGRAGTKPTAEDCHEENRRSMSSSRIPHPQPPSLPAPRCFHEVSRSISAVSKDLKPAAEEEVLCEERSLIVAFGDDKKGDYQLLSHT